MTNTEPRQLQPPHVHRWTVATVATPGTGTYAAAGHGCGQQRVFPIEPAIRWQQHEDSKGNRP